MKNKGCVVEVRDKTLVLMTASCDFVEIPRKGMGLVAPGMEVVYEARPHGFAHHKNWLAVAAMVMLLLMGSLLMLTPTSAMPVYVAHIDINPSFSMFIDETGHVVEIEAINRDAKNLITKNLKGMSVEEAVSHFMEQLVEQGYFIEQMERFLVFSLAAIDPTVPREKVGDMMVRLESTIQEEKQQREIELEVLSFAVSDDEVAEAESMEVSLNQLLVMNQYQTLMREKSSAANVEQDPESMEFMVKTIIKEKEHPVFEEHPSEQPKKHPVFEEHPGRTDDKADIVKPLEQLKEHPVFEEHPGSTGNDNADKAQPSEQPKEHPVFEEHPGNTDKNKDRDVKPDKQQEFKEKR